MPVKVLASQTTAKATFTLPPNAPMGTFNITFRGQARHMDRDYTADAPAAPLVIKK
jgi:hypothetical protein